MTDFIRATCGTCSGKGWYNNGPRPGDVIQCKNCRGHGFTETTHKGMNMTRIEQFELLSDKEVAAVHLGRTRLANNAAIKQTTDADGNKSYRPIEADDVNAVMTCEAVNVLDGLLEPYGYKFGEKFGSELTQ